MNQLVDIFGWLTMAFGMVMGLLCFVHGAVSIIDLVLHREFIPACRRIWSNLRRLWPHRQHVRVSEVN